MAKKTIPVRCRQKVQVTKTITKEGGSKETITKDVKCNRFIAELSEFSILVTCKNCGHIHMFTRAFIKPGDKQVNWNKQVLAPRGSELAGHKKE
jgi:predicted nucleic-acid-binding Zn-ribbon protein